MLKHGILGLLNYHQMSGYEIMTAFRDSLYFFWNAQTSQIYRELQTLEEKGWVDKTPIPQQSRPDKNVYTVTPEGREELLRWLSDEQPAFDTRNHILMKVFFLGERSREDNIRYFEGVREYCGIFLQSLEEAQEHIGEYRGFLDAPSKSIYWEMTLDYGRQNMRSYMNWAQSCIDRLREDNQ